MGHSSEINLASQKVEKSSADAAVTELRKFLRTQYLIDLEDDPTIVPPAYCENWDFQCALRIPVRRKGGKRSDGVTEEEVYWTGEELYVRLPKGWLCYHEIRSLTEGISMHLTEMLKHNSLDRTRPVRCKVLQ